MSRFAASVQYDGSGFHGWQSLKTGLPTVQAEVEAAFSRVANHPVSVCLCPEEQMPVFMVVTRLFTLIRIQ